MEVRPMKSLRSLAAFALLVAVAASPAFGFAQKYTNPQFLELTKDHKTVAVLPFKVTIDMKHLSKNTTVEMVQQQQKDESLEIQKILYSRLLQKSQEEGYTVGFQDADQTNALLLKAGWSLDSLTSHTKDEIAKTLGVDALVSGTVQQTQPTSTGVAVAQSLLLGFSGSTQRVDINMTVHNGADGQLLWSYDHNDKGGMMNTVEGMMKSLMKKVAGNFPYRKAK
jgi:hypothetical protein